MEKVYDPVNFLSSEPIRIREHFLKYKKILTKSKILTEQPEGATTKSTKSQPFAKAWELMRKLSDSTFTGKEQEMLAKSCSVSNLDDEDDPTQIDVKGLTLHKVICLYKPHSVRESIILRTIQCHRMRVVNFQTKVHFDYYIGKPIDRPYEIDMKPGDDVIIYIKTFRPYKYSYADTDTRRNSLKFFNEIAVLGSNTLADLRDKMHCPADIAVCQEVSEDPDFEKEYQSGKELYPSGFFFINNVFYNDFRNPNAIDYSEVIRQWAVQKNIANFSSAEMMKTRIDSINPRIGYPYVYQHKGCCEHIIIVTQIRLLNSSDSLSTCNYPYHTCIGKVRDRYCVMCGISVAKWLICGSDRLPQSKAAMCTDCFRSYHYIGSEKVGNFKAYPYFTNADVM